MFGQVLESKDVQQGYYQEKPEVVVPYNGPLAQPLRYL